MKHETRNLLVTVLCNMHKCGLIDSCYQISAISLINIYWRLGKIVKHSQKFENALSFQDRPYGDMVFFRELDEINKHHKKSNLIRQEDFEYVNSKEPEPSYMSSIMEPTYTACNIRVDVFNADEIKIAASKSEFFHIPTLTIESRQINLN